MLSQLEETLHYPMKWEKIEHQGIETHARSTETLSLEIETK